MELPSNRTNPNLVAARFVLKPGRKYEQAVAHSIAQLPNQADL